MFFKQKGCLFVSRLWNPLHQFFRSHPYPRSLGEVLVFDGAPRVLPEGLGLEKKQGVSPFHQGSPETFLIFNPKVRMLILELCLTLRNKSHSELAFPHQTL